MACGTWKKMGEIKNKQQQDKFHTVWAVDRWQVHNFMSV